MPGHGSEYEPLVLAAAHGALALEATDAGCELVSTVFMAGFLAALRGAHDEAIGWLVHAVGMCPDPDAGEAVDVREARRALAQALAAHHAWAAAARHFELLLDELADAGADDAQLDDVRARLEDVRRAWGRRVTPGPGRVRTR